ncbi:MAG: glycine--tRNA ligase subunit beta [Endomicrobiales bacterium]|nr:glycine--tRNA ligase subunit beta [Endomicrobiales bacterium]
MAKDALFEIFSEEIPAAYVVPAAEQLMSIVAESLDKRGLKYGSLKVFSTPRRLAVVIDELSDKSADRAEEMLGPSVSAGRAADGSFSPAARGFASKHGVTPERLAVKKTEKGEYFCVVKKTPGEKAEKILSEVFPAAASKLYFPKTMFWESSGFRFARPIRSVAALYGEKIVKFQIADLKSSNWTCGLHALGGKKITIPSPERYKNTLRNNCVLADSGERREIIEKHVESAAKRMKGSALQDDALIDEINYLVEHPVAVTGKFDGKYLKLPREVLITCLRKKQKFFAITDASGKLTDHFIGIRNGISEHQDVVREGYERVLEARLADAAFFFEKDKKTKLSSKAEGLKSVMFQAKLGSVYDKTVRTEQLAIFLTNTLESKSNLFAGIRDIEKAARLSKADLVTDMVFEYPELQGVMGRVYAEHDGEPKEVARAIEEHYMPVSAEAKLPESKLGAVLAMADKIDTLCGDFAAGIIPSGSQDPYGLRRMAMGLLRIILDKNFPVNVFQLIEKAFSILPESLRGNTQAVSHLKDFLRQRLESLWDAEGFRFDEVRSVLAVGFDEPLDAKKRLEALKKMRSHGDFAQLAASFKRASNILKQAEKNKAAVSDTVSGALMKEEAERQLFESVKKIENEVVSLTEKKEYLASMQKMVEIKPFVDAFFDKVMVMVEDEALRANRLAILKYKVGLFSKILDFSQLQG